jgi:DNA-binding MarR family transcriptional regulator
MRPRPPHPPVRAGEIPPSVAFLLSQLGYQVSREMSEALAEVGLEVRQFGLLRLLADSDGHSQRALGETLRIGANRMVALVDGLEHKGLIERRTHPEDRRAYAVSLTEAGSAALDQAFQAAFAVEANTCSPLDAAERAQLLGLLSKLAAAGAERGDGIPGIHPGLLEPEGSASAN